MHLFQKQAPNSWSCIFYCIQWTCLFLTFKGVSELVWIHQDLCIVNMNSVFSPSPELSPVFDLGQSTTFWWDEQWDTAVGNTSNIQMGLQGKNPTICCKCPVTIAPVLASWIIATVSCSDSSFWMHAISLNR